MEWPRAQGPRAQGMVFFGEGISRSALSRAVAAGSIRRLARGVYTADLTTPAEELVRQNIWRILANFVPDAIISDRSAALSGRLAGDGSLFVVSNVRTRDIELPGVRIVPRPGHGPFDDDVPWLEELTMSSVPRALVENLLPSRSRAARAARTLSREELEDWIARLAQEYPPDRLGRFRDRARVIAEDLGLTQRFGHLDDLIGVALDTRAVPVRSRLLAARKTGDDWDVSRVARFETLAAALEARIPSDEVPKRLAVLDATRTTHAPFFEAYFSNFIEGTEFGLDEAVEIVYRDLIPLSRPADAHDVTGTYSLVADAEEMSSLPQNAEEFIDRLRRRHARIMAGRPERRPGEFKQIPNQAGSYRFVDPEQVAGTLKEGYPFIAGLTNPFARALMVMFVVTEVHPFDDGNGRLSRVMMNAELTAAGDHRILIPIVWRNEFLSSIRRLSREGDTALIQRVMAYAWRWTSQMDFSDLVIARTMSELTNALVDSTEAERTGRQLLLPADIRAKQAPFL